MTVIENVDYFRIFLSNTVLALDITRNIYFFFADAKIGTFWYAVQTVFTFIQFILKRGFYFLIFWFNHMSKGKETKYIEIIHYSLEIAS